jgi:hypothetical protein
MKQANFKNVKVGERFKTVEGRTYVKIKACWINGEMRNAVCIEFGNYFLIGNGAVTILGVDEA